MKVSYGVPSQDGNSSGKRAAIKKALALSTLVMLAIAGLFVLAWIYTDDSNVVISAIFGTVLLVMILYVITSVWAFFYNLFYELFS